MSDFAGLWRLDGQAIPDADIRRLAQGMEGCGLSPPKVWRDGAIVLVHRQTLINPEDRAERQPLMTASGAVLAADLRLNDRPALIRALNLPDEAARWADSALLARALEQWGAGAALKKLQGEFAFAWWRPAERRLILARDFRGNRSLLFHRGRDFIAFSTRNRPLLALPDIPRDLDERALADNLTTNIDRPARTIYRAIDRVIPATFVTISAEDTRQTTYWEMPELGTLRHRNDAEVEEEAQATLDTAVVDAMRAEGPVTAFLTGGLDTANVVSTAARLIAPGRLSAITRAVDGSRPPDGFGIHHEETALAGAFAAGIPYLDWRVIGDDGGDWGEHDRRRWYLETGIPSRSPLNVAWFFPLFRDIVRRGGKVALTGAVGNAYFSYNGRTLLPELFESFRWIALAQNMLALRRRGMSAKKAALELALPYLPASLLNWKNGRTGAPWEFSCPLNPEFTRETRLIESMDMNAYRIRMGFRSRSTKLTRQWLAQDFMTYDTHNVARAQHGIDPRAPLADRRVVEFFGSLPTEQFLKDGVPRSLARRLLKGRAPERVITNRLIGMQNGDWHHRLTAQLPQMRADLERLRASPPARRMIDLDRLQTLLDTWPADAAAAEPRRLEFQWLLERGLEMARFLAWHDGANI